MSNIIPPLVSSSPPPMVAGESDDLDDEFGDFTVATDFSFDGYSLPVTPQHAASYSNFSTNTSFQSEENIASKANHVKLKNTSANGEQLSNNLENSKSYKSNAVSDEDSENAKHIFCDIKSDVNTKDVNNCDYSVDADSINLSPLNITISEQNDNDKSISINKIDEAIVPTTKVEHCFNNEENLNTNVNNDEITNTSEFECNHVKNVNCETLTPKNGSKTEHISKDTNGIIAEEFSKTVQETIENIQITTVEDVSRELNEFDTDFANITCRVENEEKYANLKVECNVKDKRLEESSDVINADFANITRNKIDEKQIESTENLIVGTNIEDERFEDSSDVVEFDTDFTCSKNEEKDAKINAGNLKLEDNIEQESLQDSSIVTNEEFEYNLDNESNEDKTINCVDNDCVSDEEFGDFKSTFDVVQSSKTTEICETNESELLTDNDSKTNEDEFADFKSTFDIPQTSEITAEIGETNASEAFTENDSKKTNKNEFADFKSTFDILQTNEITAEICGTNQCELFTDNDSKTNVPDLDDFGDFNDYSMQEQVDTKLEYNSNLCLLDSNIPEKVEKIVKSIFLCDNVQVESENLDFMANNVFKQVQDIENTNALNYHWNNSESQKVLLRALNIDSRNILFGPRWNASMPRFAANLGFTPLEPVRTDLIQSQNIATCSTAVQLEPIQCDVPAAKFDWTSSGLVNPLDYSQSNTMLLDLEQLVPSLDIPHITMTTQSDDNLLYVDIDSWEYWLQTVPNDTVKTETIEDKLSLNLNQTTDVTKQINSERNNNLHLDKNPVTNFGNLTHSDNESVNSLKFIETSAELEIELKQDGDNHSMISEDDFSGFQSSKQETENNFVPFHLAANESNIIKETSLDEQKVNIVENLKLESTIVTPTLVRKTIEISEEDDDFADFQMSLPQTDKPKPSKPIASVPLEPLKPIVLETCAGTTPAQINWPEPGVVGNDINDFEFNFTSISKDITDTPKSITIENKTKRENNKTILSTEEDDWSDFVCAPEHNNKSKPVTPPSQLELSIPNLQTTHLTNKSLPPAFIPNKSPTKSQNHSQIAVQNDYQPPYQIPLQTPFGDLPQTSLSSNTNISFGPIDLSQELSKDFKMNLNEFSVFGESFQQKQVYNMPSTLHTESQFQQNYPLQSVESTFLKMKQPVQQHSSVSNNVVADDDEDWSDFVSSQPQQVSAMHKVDYVQQPNHLNNIQPISSTWSTDILTPNIITNPVHFQGYAKYQDHKNSSHQTRNVPSISALPELDFIAPKNKFFSKK